MIHRPLGTPHTHYFPSSDKNPFLPVPSFAPFAGARLTFPEPFDTLNPYPSSSHVYTQKVGLPSREISHAAL